MKISFSTLACPDWNWEKIVCEAKRLGYDGIELRGIEREFDLSRLKPFLDENIDNTKKLLQEKNLEICCLDTSCRFHEKENIEKYLTEGMAAVDLAQKLDCKYIRVFGDAIPDKDKEEEMLVQIASSLNILGKYAHGKGVTVLVESHGSFSTGDELLKLMQRTDKEIGVIWDVTNAYVRCSEPTEDTFNKIKSYIKHTHIKDAKGDYPNAKLCMIGEGDLSIKQMINLLKSIGYEGWLSLEWEKAWHPELEEPETVLDVYINHIKKLLD